MDDAHDAFFHGYMTLAEKVALAKIIMATLSEAFQTLHNCAGDYLISNMQLLGTQM